MKVLIVSFDKTLTENLKKALEDNEIYVAKNSEEALKMIPADVEGVIYDAISGAISEEDINTLYTKKFSIARYVILYDELFPVEERNIIVPQKILVRRESQPEDIVRKLIEFPTEVPMAEPAPFEITEEMAEEVEEAIKEFEAPAEEPARETQPAPAEETGKVLIVSFDQTLIDSLKAALGQKFEVVNVKTVRQAMEQGKDANLIIFDAISGVIAEKGLIDMANDPHFANKPYVILVDDLFPINVDNIPLADKTALSRDTDVMRIKEVVEEKLAVLQAQPREEVIEEKVEEIGVEAPPIEEVPQEIPEIEIEEEAPALEALEKFMETEISEVVEEEEVSEPTPAIEETPATLTAELNVERVIEEAVSKALSEERLKEAISRALQESFEDMRGVIEEVVKREVEKVLENLDIRNLIREATYQALKERLEELIT